MKKDKQSIIKELHRCAVIYDTYYANKNFLIVYKEGNQFMYKQLVFKKQNFKHLTGINTKMSAEVFYTACLNQRLSSKDVELKSNGTTQLKLKVFPQMKSLFSVPTLIGDFNNNGFSLRVDYLMGDMKRIVSLGFKQNNEFDVPQSLLSEDVKKLTQKSHKVIAIWIKNVNETSYQDLGYIAKGIIWKELKVSVEINGKIEWSE